MTFNPDATTKSYWLSSNKMTIGVDVNLIDIIVFAPPIAKVFIGQPLDNLRRWMRKQGGYKECRLSPC